MGSASSRKKSGRSKSKTVTLTQPAKGSVKEENNQRNYRDTESNKENRTGDKETRNTKRIKNRSRSNTQAEVKVLMHASSFERKQRYLRSRSEPGDVTSLLNSSLSTSLRLSDFCKIYRKERVESDETKPLYIPYKTNEKLHPESFCHVCSVYTGSETYTCSVCYRVYHESCLAKIGQCENEAASYLHAGLTPDGWSCHLCDNVSNILTMEEITILLDMCRDCNITPEKDVTQEQYLAYRKWHYRKSLGADMTPEEVREELCVIGQLSNGLNGRISWKNFLNHEALKILEKRNENSLVRVLTDSEIEAARQMVKLRDVSGQGDITRQALLRLTSQFDRIFHITYRQDKIMFADDDLGGNVSWDRFLRDMAIFIIAERLNIFRKAVAEAKKSAELVVEAAKKTPPKCISRMTIMTKPNPRKESSRSLYLSKSGCGRLVGESSSHRRPLSLA